ncbi:MAG TPA: hypothetical protein VGN12_08660 [Pirellulales bacterium]|jgi:hypothetical protein
MSQLGDFLEVVYGPAPRFATVRATIHQWCNSGLANNAGAAKTVIGRKRVSPSSEALAVDETNISACISLPDRYRIEKHEHARGQSKESLIVVNGKHKWNRDPQGHVETSQASPKQDTDIARHFDQASLREFFVGLALQSAGEVEIAGRSCIRLRAVPRAEGRLWPHWLPYGADEYEFYADPRFGVLLYIAGRYNDAVFEVNEVTHVVFDEPLDDALFTYSPTPAEQVSPATPIVERLTLTAAVARMPFKVLIPTRLPDPDHCYCEVMYHPPRSRSPRPHLALMYKGGFSLWINEGGTADPDTADMEWEQVERDGKRMSLSDPGVGTGKRMLALEQQGTHVMMVSDLDREQLINVAASLVIAT